MLNVAGVVNSQGGRGGRGSKTTSQVSIPKFVSRFYPVFQLRKEMVQIKFYKWRMYIVLELE